MPADSRYYKSLFNYWRERAYREQKKSDVLFNSLMELIDAVRSETHSVEIARTIETTLEGVVELYQP